MIEAIICQDNVGTVVEKMQEYLQNGGTIQSIHLVDQADGQAVVLISDKEITQQNIEFFWAGFQKALE